MGMPPGNPEWALDKVNVVCFKNTGSGINCEFESQLSNSLAVLLGKSPNFSIPEFDGFDDENTYLLEMLLRVNVIMCVKSTL